MATPTFIFGADGLPKTPQEAARLRAIAQAMAPSRAPKDIGEGLSSLGDAIAYRMTMNKADKGDEMGQNAANTAFSALMGAGSDSAPTMTSNAPASPSPTPASASSIPSVDISGSKADFVSNLLPAAMEESKRTGVDPRIIVAQGALESGWGKSAPGNNLFGIKSHGQDGGNTLATTEYVNGKPVTIRDSFRAYENPAQSVRGYGDFILQNPRYKPLREAQGLDAQISALQASGYATDPKYGEKIGAIARGIQLPGETSSADPQQAFSAVLGQQQAAPQASPAQGYVDPMVKVVPPTPAPQPTQPPQQVAQAASPRKGIMDALMGAKRTEDLPTDYFPAAPSSSGAASPSRQQIMQVLANPYSTPEQRAIAQDMYQQQQQASDPLRQMQIEKGRLELDALRNPKPDLINAGDGRLYNPRTGQWITAPAGSGPSDLGLNPQYGVDAQGNPVLLQLGKDGRVIQSQMPQGVTLSKEPVKLDAGTHFVLLDPITRQPVGQIPKDLAGAEIQKARGEAEGKAQAAAASDMLAAQNALDTLNQIESSPALSQGTGFSSYGNIIPGTAGYDFQNLVEQSKSGAFLTAIQQMRGMGSLSNAEGQTATAAVNRMDTATSEEAFRQALSDYRKVITQGLERAKSKLPKQDAQPGSSSLDDLLKKYGD